MQDVEYEHVQSLVEFMYEGEVNICQTKLPAFLHTAESLQIRGLSAQSQHKVSARWRCCSVDRSIRKYSSMHQLSDVPSAHVYPLVKAPMWSHIFNTDKSSETYQIFFYKKNNIKPIYFISFLYLLLQMKILKIIIIVK